MKVRTRVFYFACGIGLLLLIAAALGVTKHRSRTAIGLDQTWVPGPFWAVCVKGHWFGLVGYGPDDTVAEFGISRCLIRFPIGVCATGALGLALMGGVGITAALVTRKRHE
jgi:hypothetical protein